MSAEPKTQAEQDAYAAGLLDAQTKAASMFDEIERDLLRPGISEKALNDAIHALGEARHNVRTHWHKRVIRSGENTLCPFEENPPDRIIQEDDILVVDLGPVFENWEADFGRTYVMGNDPAKLRLRDALEPMWLKVKGMYDERPNMSGEELYEIACNEAQKEGFEFGAPLAGHIVGSFPHERIPRDKITLYISKGNKNSMVSTGKNGFKRHWILEIHLRDPVANIQGFSERLLTVA